MMMTVVEILLVLALALNIPSSAPEAMLRKELEESSETYTITTYCSCQICCGRWALLRKEGDPVYVANGEIAEVGITCAADWSINPPGTLVYIDGFGVRSVQDNGSGVIGKHIDIYMDTHEAASQFGLQYRKVLVLPYQTN